MAELYLLPGELPEDIKQDMAIAHLTGRKASMKRLHDRKDIGYGLKPAADAVPIWSIVPRPDYSLIERLTTFILAQEEGIKHAILAYLSEPDDGRLASVVQALGIKLTVVERAPITLTDLILKALPATMDDLYQLAHVSHKSKKPEAAVRQNVRNLIRSKRVVWVEGELCRAGGSANQTRKSSEKAGHS